MLWDKQDFQVEFSRALKRYNRAKIDELCDNLINHLNYDNDLPEEDFAKRVLDNLRRKRCFTQLRIVADALIQNGLTTPKIRRLYAQSLLDQGELSSAIPYLEALVTEIENDAEHESELAEAKGLIGRAYKQIYVNIGRTPSKRAAAALNAAIKSYLAVYSSHPNLHTWHGINTAALLMRAKKEQIEVNGIDDPEQKGREIAERILSYISMLWERWEVDVWHSVTAMEACVALERHDDATIWLKRYVSEPLADAFELGSTLRQMEEIWRLDVDSEPGASILSVLRAELLQKEGGALTVDAKKYQPGALAKKPSKDIEKILGSVRYHSYKFMLRSIDCARAVARIENMPGQGFGTGFLVPSDHLHEKLGGDFVLITNAHVVSDDGDVKDALFPEDAIVTFQLLAEEGKAHKEYSVSDLLWTSPPWKLDTSILRLQSVPEGINPISVHSRLPVPDGEQRVYIIGHPKGGSLSFSIQDNVLIDHDDPYLHYRTPTEGGSSGSPVFNAQWKLIGLHHAGSLQMPKLHDKKGTYEANEGIWIQSIKKELTKKFRNEN